MGLLRRNTPRAHRKPENDYDSYLERAYEKGEITKKELRTYKGSTRKNSLNSKYNV